MKSERMEDGKAAQAEDHDAILAINTIRTLAIDGVEKANSGHPGTPLALAPVAYTLWSQFLRFDPAAPLWPNRDRFILSIGHASMLLYSILHLAEVAEVGPDGMTTGKPAVSLADLQSFRQLGSKTPGHPEYRMTTGVEATTGPLGQGCACSVGMAISERWLAARFNREGFSIFDHDVYVLCGDGDMMEGISSEAASLAAHLKLSNLCWIYDSNRISIEGHTSLAFTEDVAARFRGYGWKTIQVNDANDTGAIASALSEFRENDASPTLIVVRSVIGYASPKADSENAHGSPLGADAVRATKRALGWAEDRSFFVPEGVQRNFTETLKDHAGPLREQWEEALEKYKNAHPKAYADLSLLLAGKLPQGWGSSLPSFPADAKGIASRESGAKAENAIADAISWLVGGSADLAPSTKTLLAHAGSFQASEYSGSNLHFGVRENAMGAIVNGMTLSYLRGFGATFLVFSDYMRPSIRLAAIMQLPSIYVFTHDSIGVGEDGPTHQPVEHLAGLRAVPGIDLIRPADANEVAEAWKLALEANDHPTCLVFSRQSLPTLDRDHYSSVENVARGAYVLTPDDGGSPDVILIATGSEVALAVRASKVLISEGVKTRVVSMPSWYRFERQDQSYRDGVLPRHCIARVAIEAGSPLGWDRYVGPHGRVIGMRSFGASGPIEELHKEFGFTAEQVVRAAQEVMRQ